ncbi:MAG: DNA gyrase subunit A [Oscillospiraceae bacterium]|nr:DNA gyrase subunit A [Oscillospiraceae bacterium]
MKDETRDISFPNQKIVDINLEHEMESAYIEYAMSVIVGRALPDVRDGLKPVHRRILYSMYENNLTQDRPYKKSATCVGDVLGKYHPHGDQSVYDALVRLAQDFSMRYPLIDGHGNFGSVDGDPPAAYRYTEARMSGVCNEMMRDIEKETVDKDPNFDDSAEEPRVVPARFPNLLVNGSSGIAVGMTTNIPPHNLKEVIDATICVIRNPGAELEELTEHIKGPDFPTRGVIMGRAGIRAAYATGKGRIKVRARTETEEFGGGRIRIIVTELPYQVNKSRLVESIAEQVKEKRIEGISGLRDESDGKKGMRIVIELKREANVQVVLNRLFAQTQMQTTFGIILLALVNDQRQPKTMSLREILDEYIAFQEQIITRRTVYDRKKASERAHILEGLLKAQENIDEVIRIIRTSYDEAKNRLIERFGFTDVQAQAILDMRLRSLQGLEREKLSREHEELTEKIAFFDRLLSDKDMLREVLVSELEEIKEKYGDERRTEIAVIEDEIDIEDLIDEEECVYTLTHAGYIKRIPAATYKAQRRGGRGITAQSLREEDYVETLFTASTHDYILFFTSLGRVYRKKGYFIPEAGRTAKGTNIINLLPIEQGERINAMILTRDIEAEKCWLFMTTRNGTVKRLPLEALKNIRNVGIRALSLDEGDELISVRKTDGTKNILIATHDGYAICFDENDVRAMGRTATGVRGIKLRSGDYCVGAARARAGGSLLSVTENGYGKRTAIEEYLRGPDTLPQRRGGLGVKNYKVTEKTGKIADVRIVDDDDDILMISDDGTIIRMGAESISTYSRATQGVKLMRIAEGSKVICIARIEKEEIEDGEEDFDE